MKLYTLFESKFDNLVLEFLSGIYKNSVYVEFPLMHSSISMGVHHWSSEVAADIISYSWVQKFKKLELSERYKLQRDTAAKIRLVISLWEHDRLKNTLETLGLFTDNPDKEFHTDDEFEAPSSTVKRLIVDASGVSIGNTPMTWWPKEVIDALIQFRRDTINKVIEHIEWEHSQKRDFWSK